MDLVFHYLRSFKELKNVIMYVGVVVIILFFSLTVPNFLSPTNLITILISMATIAVLGIGVTFVLTIGEIDISTGALLSVPSVILAVLLRAGFPLLVSLGIGLISALMIGFLNGVITIKVGLPSFITTLGTSGIAMGLSRIISGNTPIAVKNDFLLNLFGKEFFGIPKIVLWMLLLAIVGYFILHKTRFGRNLQCVGDNREAAFLYGINIKKTVILAFMICSIYVFFAGMLMLARTSFATPGEGEALVLNAIVASVIGGTSIQGGKGSIIGALFGAFFLTVISNGLFLLKFPSWTSSIIIGIIILVVLTISSLREKREREMKRT
ncbi:MAG: ribose transport system permease protein [Clostridiales bacterium]|jgi:ribose/xylose/arabinose/galactoside ABC-type transport system permease subunit|nr:ribose transport system permease protein [Clostridiales bacterium]MDK2934602.1 ribose transport system permease protein [Clostridiales bacterium]